MFLKLKTNIFRFFFFFYMSNYLFVQLRANFKKLQHNLRLVLPCYNLSCKKFSFTNSSLILFKFFLLFLYLAASNNKLINSVKWLANQKIAAHTSSYTNTNTINISLRINIIEQKFCYLRKYKGTNIKKKNLFLE